MEFTEQNEEMSFSEAISKAIDHDLQRVL